MPERILALLPRLSRAVLVLPLLLAPGALADDDPDQHVNPGTWVDHDAQPAPKPEEHEENLYKNQFHEAVVQPFSHAFDVPDKILWILDAFGLHSDPEAVNVNIHDEVPNSTWFTNRNHIRSLDPEALRIGPGGEDIRPEPPLVITAAKQSGMNAGFTIKDAADRTWIVKFDPPGHPQLGSGADAVTSRLLHAAGYNVPYDVAFSFRREDLRIDQKLDDEDEDPPMELDELVALLQRGAEQDGNHYAVASLYLEGEPLGPFDLRNTRSDDPNDKYAHNDRREMRGLYVLASWLNSWDVKEHQTLDMFHGDSLGHVEHHLIDHNASLGASAEGPKARPRGFEHFVDWGKCFQRLVTLGFVDDAWRRAPQESGIPSVGNFQAEVFDPDGFRPMVPHPAFRNRTDRDSYWGAKLVASFSDRQVEAAVAAAGYEDPRASRFLTRVLIDRRDRIARYWFDRVAPLDFFHMGRGALRFHDLAVDRRLEPARAYEVKIEGEGDERRIELSDTFIPLEELEGLEGPVELKIEPDGFDGTPVRVTLERIDDQWTIARVRHG